VANFRDDAICIRHWDWSETSQTVSLLTRAHGVLRGIAKGAKREKGNFSGGIELLTAGQIIAMVKPHSSLATLTSWDLIETYPILRTSLAAHNAGMYMADLTGHLVHEGDPHEALFDALVGELGRLDRSPAMLSVLRFQWAALCEAGYRPVLDKDAQSGEPIETAQVCRFHAQLGGFVNPTARDDASVWKVRAETRRLLQTIASDSEAEQGQSTKPVDERSDPLSDVSRVDVERAARLLAAYVREILGRELASYHGVFGHIW
jgi:DNA repair protein RecO (recombination protein O)